MDKEVWCCSIRTLKSKKRECHKLTIVTYKPMISFLSLTEDKEKNLFKTDLVKQKNEAVTVCAHHEAFILNTYSSKILL